MLLLLPICMWRSVTNCSVCVIKNNQAMRDAAQGRVRALMVPHSDYTTARLKLVAIVARSSLSQQQPITIHKLLWSVIPGSSGWPARSSGCSTEMFTELDAHAQRLV